MRGSAENIMDERLTSLPLILCIRFAALILSVLVMSAPGYAEQSDYGHFSSTDPEMTAQLTIAEIDSEMNRLEIELSIYEQVAHQLRNWIRRMSERGTLKADERRAIGFVRCEMEKIPLQAIKIKLTSLKKQKGAFTAVKEIHQSMKNIEQFNNVE